LAALRGGVASIIRDLKQRINATIQSVVWTALAGIFALVVAGFLCAALFVWIESFLGTLIACLVLAGLFLLLAIVCVLVASGIRRAEARRAELRAQSMAALWRDPAVISAGLKLGRQLGLKRAAPVAMLGAFVIGLLLSRASRRQASADPD
jgi:putative superfamily III holin-X